MILYQLAKHFFLINASDRLVAPLLCKIDRFRSLLSPIPLTRWGVGCGYGKNGSTPTFAQFWCNVRPHSSSACGGRPVDSSIAATIFLKVFARTHPCSAFHQFFYSFRTRPREIRFRHANFDAKELASTHIAPTSKKFLCRCSEFSPAVMCARGSNPRVSAVQGFPGAERCRQRI